jgi:tagatose kinase
MALDLLTFGEALVEVMRTGIDQPLDRPALFTGPYPSGAPFIFAVQAARLGAKVGAVGAVGDDAFGRCLLEQLKVDGVETRGVHVLPDHTTGVAFVAYNGDGSREFVFHARHAAAGQLSVAMLDEALFEGLRCLHIMGSTLSMHSDGLQMGLKALELAKQHGAKISFDPNLRPQLLAPEQAVVAFRPFVEAADVLIPTREELELLVPDGIEAAFVRHPHQIIVMTEGKNGCTVFSADQPQGLHVAGFQVDEIDPTGAGDCFDAGFLVQWLQGASMPDAARFANACGALAVTAQGPMAGARMRDEVERFMIQGEHA